VGQTPAVAMLSASTVDSQSVTITYRIDGIATGSAPLQFGIYRSADPTFDASDNLVSTWTVPSRGSSSVDRAGEPAAAVGTHQLSIPIADGLPPYPQKPYVIVVADPGLSVSLAAPEQTASFRTYTIGIVTHGALINSSWKHGPPWQLQIATLMKRQGYDAVIPFSWVSQSSTPGHAVVEGPILARKIEQVASRFPPTAPVDLHFVGHSEGTVVNTQAIVAIESAPTTQISMGFIQDTLLDPHAANNNAPGQSSTAGGIFGGIARDLISGYQGRANDPPVYIPAGVDVAQVFYQHTKASHDHGVNNHIYNLWGQVPVPNLSGHPVYYYNLTAAGATHSGNSGVALWYRNFVAPTLGRQAPLLQALQLSGQVEGTTTPLVSGLSRTARHRASIWGMAALASTSQPEFSGTAAPGSRVRVYLGPAADPSAIVPAGRTMAGDSGAWAFTPRPLPRGRYRAVAMSFAGALRTRPGLTIVPMTPLGRFTVSVPR
jgi:hypothetical protein